MEMRTEESKPVLEGHIEWTQMAWDEYISWSGTVLEYHFNLAGEWLNSFH